MKAKHLLLFATSALIGSREVDSAPPPSLQLQVPLACEIGRNCEIQNYVDRDPGSAARDYACASRTYDAHNGIDFRIPDMASQRAAVAVLAAAPGTVVSIRDAMEDISVKSIGIAAVKGRECGNSVVVDHGAGWESQYCHMARGSISVKAGDAVRAGQPLGRVGLSGFTEYPHLHLTVRKGGRVVDPFDPDPADHGCKVKGDLWSPAARKALVYKRGVVLNIGLTVQAITADQLEDGRLPGASAASPALVAYVRVIGLERGDTQLLELRAPDGTVLASSSIPALDRAKAQWFTFAGKKRSDANWPAGDYAITYTLMRANAAVASKRLIARI
jgi:hypothetical protein